MFKVKASSEYSKVDFGQFPTLEEAMKMVKLIQGIATMLESIEHAEVPYYMVYAYDSEKRYYSDGSTGTIHEWDREE